MNMTIVAQQARTGAARLGAWALRRARERSTWVGLAAVAGALGKSVWADHLTSLADVVPMLLGAGGAALVAASTSTSKSTSAQPPA